MIELHINDNSGEELLHSISQKFDLAIEDNGIKHTSKDKSFVVYRYDPNTNVTIVKATVNEDIRVLRFPDPTNPLTLITISNFSTNFNPEKPDFLVNSNNNFQIGITNSVEPNSIDIPKNKEITFITFRIKNFHLKNFDGANQSPYYKLLENQSPFYAYHFLPHKTEQLVSKLFSFNGSKDWRRLMKLSVAYEILADIYMVLRASAPLTYMGINPLHMKQVLNMQSYILKFLNDDLTVDKLSQEFSMSESSIHKAFKKVLNTSPYHFIKNERLKKSRDLLISSPDSISQIAFQMNFSSPSHFVSTFKKTYGLTPATYRQANV